MTRWLPRPTALILSLCVGAASAPPGIELVATRYIPGNVLDKSGLAGVICQAGNPGNCVPKAVFGGFGSALAWRSTITNSSSSSATIDRGWQRSHRRRPANGFTGST